VELIMAFEICKLLKYKESLGINVPRDLSSKMKMKGIKTRRAPKELGKSTVFTLLNLKPHLLEDVDEGARANQRQRRDPPHAYQDPANPQAQAPHPTIPEYEFL